jgi:sugar lactone lactonase YvrE
MSPELVTHPCRGCGAPLPIRSARTPRITCAHCGAVNEVSTTPPAQPEQKGSNPILIPVALLLALFLFVGGAVSLDRWDRASDAEAVQDLKKLAPSERLSTSKLTVAPDGIRWVVCRHERLCAISPDGKLLGIHELPFVSHDQDPQIQRGGNTRGMVLDPQGRLYLSHGKELLVVRPQQGGRALERLPPVRALPPGEHATCLAVGGDGALWAMTSRDDLVKLDAQRNLQARIPRPMLSQDPRHHGCGDLLVAPDGRIFVTPEEAPALYRLDPTGKPEKRHAPGGAGAYMGLALWRGSLVVGHYDKLLRFDVDFRPLPAPKTQRDGWEWVSDAATTPDGSLLVLTRLGFLARWKTPSGK